MRLGLGFVFLSVTFMLSACSSGPSESEFAPKIGNIETSIVHSHPSVHAQAEYQRTIDVIARVTVTDPDGSDDITDLYIYDKNNSRKWRLIEGSEINEDADCKETLAVIECSFYSVDRPDTIQLLGYEMVAIDRHGYSSSKVFEFKLPAGEVVEDQEFVYSEIPFSGDYVGLNNSIAALEVMTIAGNEMVFTLDEGEDEKLLHLEFVSEDSRVREYGLELYDDSTPPELVGEVLYNTAKIQSKRINPGVKTIIDIPVGQISFIGENTVSNINRLQVVLFDEPIASTQLEINSKWFNYRGYSEIITLDL